MLEKYDSPVVMINQPYQDEDWGVVATYLSQQDVLESEDKVNSTQVGWYVSITLPNLDDVDFDQVFRTAEAALDYGIKQILSGRLATVASASFDQEGKSQPFGHYHSIV
jgi:hypothetical protein